MLQDYVHKWWMPFAWIMLWSVVSVPLAIYYEHGMMMQHGEALQLAYGTAWVQRTELYAALWPYLLNLFALLWFFSHDGTTRWAAFWAGLVALARIGAAVALINMSSVPVGTEHYIDWHALRFVLWFQDFEMLILMAVVWGAFSRFAGNGSTSSAHGAYYAEA